MQDVILQCMTLALKLDLFADNVYLWPPATMHKLQLRTTNYIRIEEIKTLWTKFCTDIPAN